MYRETAPRWRSLAAAVLALIALAVATGPVRAQDRAVMSSPELQWKEDHISALASAKAAGRPMLLYLYTRQAYSCRDMEQITFRTPAIVGDMKNFELAAVNVTQNPDLQRSLQIVKVPTVVFFAPTGSELFRAIGYKPPNEFPDYLKAIPRTPVAASTGGKAPAAGAVPEFKATYDPSMLVLQQRPGTSRVRFQLEAPSAYIVAIMGEFNDWKQDTLPMNRDSSGVWYIDLYLSNGLYHYQFFVDGKAVIDPNARFSKYIHELKSKASTVIVGPMPGPEVGPRQADGTHPVVFNYYNRDATKVMFHADFDNFDEHPMFPRGDGNWGILFNLPPGTYEYFYNVNDTWVTDDRNPIGGKRGGSSLIIDP